jgi:glycosyltransferase involved in cell wall biosynthesis
MRETLDGIDVIRVWVKASPEKSTVNRMAFYTSYMVNAALAGFLFARGGYDLLYVTSPPLFVGAAGLALSVLRGIPMVFEVRDLWPESAVTLGELRDGKAVQLATRLEEACYARAKRIVVTAQEIEARLVSRGIPSDKLALVRNGSNVDLFHPDPAAGDRIRAALDLRDQFIVLYAGLFGLAYDLEGVIEVAEQLNWRVPDVHFLLVGDGPSKKTVEARAAASGVKNVTILPAQPRETIPDYFNAADVSLVPLREPTIFGMMPVKIYDSMACRAPLIVAATGEPRTVVEGSNAGVVVDPGDQRQLRDALLRLYADPGLRETYGRNGRAAVCARYSRDAQARRLTQLLEDLVSR